MKDPKEEESIRALVEQLTLAERRLNFVLRRCAHRQMAGSAIHPDQLPLLYLIGSGECGSQVELARTLGVSPAAIAVSIKRLEKGGYVEKVANQTDLRYNAVSLTEKGQEMAEQAHAGLQQMIRCRYRGFSQEELAQLLDFNKRIIHNLEACRSEMEKGV